MFYTIGNNNATELHLRYHKDKKVQCHVEPGIRLYDPSEC